MFALPLGRASFSLCLALVTAVLAAAGSAQAQFNPQRTFPNTTTTIGVFVDQLPSGMTAAQDQFAATHYAGTQKLTTNLIDPIRADNPDFIMLQYRLGVRDSGDQVSFIHNNTWSSDWAAINPNENWFVHVNGNDTASGRLYQLDGSVKEWIMDAGGLINGNTNNGWMQFWVNETLADASASHADGTFADGCVLPWAPDSNNSPVGPAPCTAYIPDLEAFYSYVYQQYTAHNAYFIPNVGPLITTADTTQGYYTNVSGVMMEGFAVKTSDWTMEQNRTLKLLNNGKIWIAQNYLSSNSDVAAREWYLTNYLLLKSSQSFINVPSTDSQLYWWPEYNLNMGSPTDALPTSISAYAVANGLYLRHYQNGFVLVNPSGSAESYTFSANDPRYLVGFSGGGDVDANGNAPAGSLMYTLQHGGTISVPAWSGEILMVLLGDTNHDGVVNSLDIDAIYQNLTVAPSGYQGTWPRALMPYQAQYDVNGDGKVTQDDVTYELNHYFLTSYGDADLNKATDFQDFQTLLNHWQATGPSVGWAQADFNGDGVVDFLDFQMLLNYWNPGGWNFAPSQAPEPTTLALLGLGGLALLRRRKTDHGA